MNTALMKHGTVSWTVEHKASPLDERFAAARDDLQRFHSHAASRARQERYEQARIDAIYEYQRKTNLVRAEDLLAEAQRDLEEAELALAAARDEEGTWTSVVARARERRDVASEEVSIAHMRVYRLKQQASASPIPPEQRWIPDDYSVGLWLKRRGLPA